MDSPLDYTNYLKLFSCCPHKEELRDRQVYSYVEEGVLSSQFTLTTSASVMELLIPTNLDFSGTLSFILFFIYLYILDRISMKILNLCLPQTMLKQYVQ